jgi:hypothetical protein
LLRGFLVCWSRLSKWSFAIRGLEVGGFEFPGNKKGPEEAPCAPPLFGWRLAIPGGAPGYDDDKQFGNFITHNAALTSQRLREHTCRRLKVKPQAQSISISSLAGVLRRGEG